MFNYRSLGIISGFLVVLGTLGSLIALIVPIPPLIFNMLFILGIIGIVFSTFLYSLHLYEFGSRLMSNFALGTAILFFLLSFNIVHYTTLADLVLSGPSALQNIVIYCAGLFIGSWIILFLADRVRDDFLQYEHKPVITEELPTVTGAFAISCLVILFIAGNAFFSSSVAFNQFLDSQIENQTLGNVSDLSDSGSEMGLMDAAQSNAPMMDAVKDFFDEQFHPEIAQARKDTAARQWNASVAMLDDGYQNCSQNAWEVMSMSSLDKQSDRDAICDGIHNGTLTIQQSEQVMSYLSSSSSFDMLSQQSEGMLLMPSIDKVTSTCQDLEIQCRQAELDLSKGNTDGFTTDVQNTKSDLNELKVDYTTADVFHGANSDQS